LAAKAPLSRRAARVAPILGQGHADAPIIARHARKAALDNEAGFVAYDEGGGHQRVSAQEDVQGVGALAQRKRDIGFPYEGA
jgi:hypothetical protein